MDHTPVPAFTCHSYEASPAVVRHVLTDPGWFLRALDEHMQTATRHRPLNPQRRHRSQHPARHIADHPRPIDHLVQVPARQPTTEHHPVGLAHHLGIGSPCTRPSARCRHARRLVWPLTHRHRPPCATGEQGRQGCATATFAATRTTNTRCSTATRPTELAVTYAARQHHSPRIPTHLHVVTINRNRAPDPLSQFRPSPHTHCVPPAPQRKPQPHHHPTWGVTRQQAPRFAEMYSSPRFACMRKPPTIPKWSI